MKNRFEVGEPFETTVVAVTNDTVFIDLSAKSEGLVDKADFTDEDGNCTVKEGDKVTVYFTSDVRGEMHFTAKLAGQKADTSMLENADLTCSRSATRPLYAPSRTRASTTIRPIKPQTTTMRNVNMSYSLINTCKKDYDLIIIKKNTKINKF